MKKLIVLIAALILCLGLLSGCQCQHKWEDSNCLTPKTCTLCGLTEGAALGHNWTAASCTSPKTCATCGLIEGTVLEHTWKDATCTEPAACSVCGATEGEPLGHDYSLWKAQGDEMSRTCDICWVTETEPVDHAVILNQLLEGHWNFLVISSNGSHYSYNMTIDGVRYFMFSRAVFFPNNTFEIYYPSDDSLTGFSRSDFNCEFQSVEERDDGIFTYYFTYRYAGTDETPFTGWVTEQYDGWIGLGLFNGFRTEIYFRNPELEAAVAGTWFCEEDGQRHRLEFKADGTVSGDLSGQQISGAWNLLPKDTDDGESNKAKLRIYYTANGTETIIEQDIRLNDSGLELGTYLDTHNLEVSFPPPDPQHHANYVRMDEEEIALLETARKEGPQKLVGSWISDSVSVYGHGRDEETNTADYSITFAEDGTFTAVLDKECKGTWVYKQPSIYDGIIVDGIVLHYEYELTFEGLDKPVLGQLLNNGELHITSFGSDDSYVSICFLTKEMIAQRAAALEEAANLVTGTWTGTRCLTSQYYDDMWRITRVRSIPDYSITISDDGTFTALLDQAYTGTWSYTHKDEYDYDYYYYDLLFDGVAGSVHADLCVFDPDDGAQDRCFRICVFEPEDRTLEFRQLSASERSNILEASEQIPGTWSATAAYRYDDSFENRTELPDFAYSITIAADGTYTAVGDKTETGTWCYSSCSDDLSAWYEFEFVAPPSHGWGYLLEDGTIQFWINDYDYVILERD